jgi:hypothetical protein
MDFIERMFGISPDGGDGSTELIIVSVLVNRQSQMSDDLAADSRQRR